MATSEIKVGTKVIASGYEGMVTEICVWDTNLVVVKLASGTICVDKTTFDGRYEDNYIVEPEPITHHHPDCSCARCHYGDDAYIRNFHASEY
jgi:hypothetical protein